MLISMFENFNNNIKILGGYKTFNQYVCLDL